MKLHEFIIVFILGIFVTSILFFVTTTSPQNLLPQISTEQKLADINDLNTRIQFCKSMGYSDAGLITKYDNDIFKWKEVPNTNMGYGKYSGQSYPIADWMPTEIVCKRPGKIETRQYNYEQYKRWMLNIEINRDK